MQKALFVLPRDFHFAFGAPDKRQCS
ncbi:uncharacterized protein METZ01_LOCUS486855, partial [marine metagenome]